MEIRYTSEFKRNIRQFLVPKLCLGMPSSQRSVEQFFLSGSQIIFGNSFKDVLHFATRSVA